VRWIIDNNNKQQQQHYGAGGGVVRYRPSPSLKTKLHSIHAILITPSFLLAKPIQPSYIVTLLAGKTSSKTAAVKKYISTQFPYLDTVMQEFLKGSGIQHIILHRLQAINGVLDCKLLARLLAFCLWYSFLLSPPSLSSAHAHT